MASDLHKYSVQESLNLMMNSGEDALKVDIDNVTLKTEGSDINIEVHTDKTEDSMLMFSHTVAAGTGGTSLVPLVDSDGHLQVDALSSALPSGAATAANQTTIIGHVDGIETLQTSTNTKLDTLETTLTAIETDQAAIETLLTAANVDHAANEVLLGTIDADTNAIKGHVDGIETLITSTNSKIDTFDAVLDNILTKNTEIDAVLDTIKTDTGTIDSDTDAIKTAVEAVNQAAEGTISATTQRVTIATDDDGVTHLATIAGAVDTQMQVDVVAALPAGDNNIGNVDIASSVGLTVDLGSNNDVRIESGQIKSGAIASGAVASGAIASGAVASGAIASGALASGSVADGAMVTLGAKADAKSAATDATAITAMQVLKQVSASVQEIATDTGTIDSDTDAIKTAVELIDDTVAVLGTATYSETSTKGSVVGAVRNDDLAALAGTDNEIAPLQVNASGALYTTEASGQAGSIFVADTSAITSKISGTVFTAIQFIEDTVFNSGNAGLISATNQLYPSSQYECTDIDDDGFVVDGVTFPQGMTIFGRWTGFTLVSGKVIAYIGYV